MASLISRLLRELSTSDERDADFSTEQLDAVTGRLLSEPGFAALLAFDPSGEAVAVLTLSDCASIYALGRFGEIAEFYVVPEHRSTGLGARMIHAAASHGRERNWTRLEVGAPDLPRWQRTVDFYERCGFAEVGPRLKLSLTE